MAARSASPVTSPVSDLERARMRARPREPSVMHQRWSQLGFLHWPADPRVLASVLPPGLELDLWDGRAYVGVVPFRIDRARASCLPPLPGLSAFDELNLRTYVHRAGRAPGVWFFSLDASSLMAVWGARALYKLPYFKASITVVPGTGKLVSFVCQRTEGARPHFACTYAPKSAATAARVGSLEFFLAERYLLYSWDGVALRSARVWHDPYPLAEARVHDLDEDLIARAGIELASSQKLLSHYAEEVDVRIYAPRRVPEDVRASVGDVPERTFEVAPSLVP